MMTDPSMTGRSNTVEPDRPAPSASELRHDLYNVLFSISSLVEVVAVEADERDLVLECVDRLRVEIRRMRDLTGQLVDVMAAPAGNGSGES